MNENTTMVLRGALTHLRVQQQEIETAIAAILAVLGEGELRARRGASGAGAATAPPGAPDATRDAIDQAYRRMARELHPDVSGHSDAMVRLNQAVAAARRVRA